MGFFLDLLLGGLGDQRARGRVEHRAATNALWGDWERYAGRNDIRKPTLQDFQDFMQSRYDITLNEDGSIDASQRVDLRELIPRVARKLLNNGTITIGSPEPE